MPFLHDAAGSSACVLRALCAEQPPAAAPDACMPCHPLLLPLLLLESRLRWLTGVPAVAFLVHHLFKPWRVACLCLVL